MEISSSNLHDVIPEESSAKERHYFSFNQPPGEETDGKTLPTEEDASTVKSPVWSRRSEADTISFTSAYSQLQHSDESLEMNETTV